MFSSLECHDAFVQRAAARPSCGKVSVTSLGILFSISITQCFPLELLLCGNPLQCSCLENPRDGEVWWAAVYGVTQSRKQLTRLSNNNKGFPGGSVVKNSACPCRRHRFDP